MRASIVIAASLAGLIAGAAAARAADLTVEPYGDGGYGACCYTVYQPIPQVVILDDEPGVVVRRWWLPPWRNRHYYPHSRAFSKTHAARTHERRHAARARPRPAPRYVRYWTNPPAYGARPAPLIGPDINPPRPRPRRYLPPPAAAP